MRREIYMTDKLSRSRPEATERNRKCLPNTRFFYFTENSWALEQWKRKQSTCVACRKKNVWNFLIDEWIFRVIGTFEISTHWVILTRTHVSALIIPTSDIISRPINTFATELTIFSNTSFLKLGNEINEFCCFSSWFSWETLCLTFPDLKAFLCACQNFFSPIIDYTIAQTKWKKNWIILVVN